MFSPLLRKEGQTVTLDLISYGRSEDFKFKMRGSLLNACFRINYVIIGCIKFFSPVDGGYKDTNLNFESMHSPAARCASSSGSNLY